MIAEDSQIGDKYQWRLPWEGIFYGVEGTIDKSGLYSLKHLGLTPARGVPGQHS